MEGACPSFFTLAIPVVLIFISRKDWPSKKQHQHDKNSCGYENSFFHLLPPSFPIIAYHLSTSGLDE
jgi:hypothetical protein